MITASRVVVATAVSDRWEAALVSGLEGQAGVRVVRRCADLAEALACASAGLVQAVVVSADLRGFDAAAVDLLRHHRVGVVALVDPAHEASGGLEHRLRQVGVAQVLPVSAAAAAVAAAARAAVEAADASPEVGPPTASLADPRATPRAGERRAGGGATEEPSQAPALPGRVVSVWGPVGGPGRTTLAVELAAELASAGQEVLLVDADTYGASIAQRLGLLDESAGVAAACRAADRGGLDPGELIRLAPVVLPRLRLLTGLVRPDRWPEVRASALATVLQTARAVADWVVVDTGFCLEQDEELTYDTVAPRRNQTTLAALAESDLVTVVGAADPVGLQRLVRGLREIAGLDGFGSPLTVVANRVRASAVGNRPGRQVREALRRYAGVDDVLLVPDDPDSVDAAVLAGRTLGEHARASPVRAAVRDLVVRLRAQVTGTAEDALVAEAASAAAAPAH